jgi:hypothetical protein
MEVFMADITFVVVVFGAGSSIIGITGHPSERNAHVHADTVIKTSGIVRNGEVYQLPRAFNDIYGLISYLGFDGTSTKDAHSLDFLKKLRNVSVNCGSYS